jgi:type IV secretory pathway VirB6-like protein
MKVINTKTHGYLDYIMGVVLIASPWMFNFARNGAETWVPVILGIATILYSLFTNYELGISRMIPMRTHLILDTVGGVFLAASPWLFGFADYIWQPHLILGILELGAVLMTKTEPGERRTPAESTMHRHATGH